MNVLKFGGTSVGTVESLTYVKKIVESRNEPVIVVVSALGGVTDMLINAAQAALVGSNEWENIFADIELRHRTVVDKLIDPSQAEQVWADITEKLNRLKKYYQGIQLVEDLSERTLCNVVSFGERMSSVLVGHIIRDAKLLYSPDFIKTEKWFGKNIAVADLTEALIRQTFRNTDFQVAVVPGFISSDRDTGDITNLGRGGSDYTAALIAAALDADSLEIWTDVNGFMTADPRIIREAEVIPHLSFLESMDLCNFGAKVIYPPTIYPVFHKNIPIRILNTFNHTAPGTYITDEHLIPVARPFRGVTSIADVSMLQIEPTKQFSASMLRNRALNVLTKKGVEILLSVYHNADDFGLQQEDSGTVRIALRAADAARAEQMLKEDLSGEGPTDILPTITVLPNVSTVTLVGENLKKDPQAADRMLHTLRRAGIQILTAGRGSSGFAMTAVVPREDMTSALDLLHSQFLTASGT
ncbi:MAG: aspartate kinase [Prevotella sp.]|nr:aspartate kinase [Prevotella sp.]MCM1074647.1 aspartate kinase [Ruminococcus sp.]